MKKFLPVFLVVICLAAVVFGVYMLTSDPSSASAANGNKEAVGAHALGADLLDVRTPQSLADRRKSYEGFNVSFNADNRTPNWVAWELLRSETSGETGRYNKFWQDEELDGCPTTRDYSNSGYDRGHLCPAADQKWSPEAMVDCFSLANIAPQDHSLNTGAWKTLENKERQWAERDSAIVIVAGPIYEKSDTIRIGQAGVRVPGAFFKVMIAPYLDQPRGIAFVYPNMTAPGNMENYVMTIRDVEKLTGYDFFHNLPDELEEAVETVSSFRDWNRKR